MIMKKIIAFLLVLILAFPVGVSAAEKYISIDPYPFSTHVLGEDLVIYGNTNIAYVNIGLYYPDIPGFYGYAKYIMTISAKELREGYSIPTDALSDRWPEGTWKVIVQSGTTVDQLYIPMTAQPSYNRYVRIAEYASDTLVNVKTHLCRGIEKRNGVLKITPEDGTEIRIFSWNNLAPSAKGATQLFIATYENGYMTEVKTYTGNLVKYGNHVRLNINEGSDRLEIFCWEDNLIPVS